MWSLPSLLSPFTYEINTHTHTHIYIYTYIWLYKYTHTYIIIMLNFTQSSAVITWLNITWFSIWFDNEVKYASEVIFTKDTPYLALTGELWGVFCEDLGENWPRYKGTALCMFIWYLLYKLQNMYMQITPCSYPPLLPKGDISMVTNSACEIGLYS